MARPVKLCWLPSSEISVAHAARIVATGSQCTDQRTERLLAPPMTQINNRLVTVGIDVGQFWETYLDRCVGGDSTDTAVSASLIEAGCNVLQVEQTAKAINNRLGDARHAFLTRFPKLDEQLPLRARPMRDRWETIGPGLVREVERQVWQNSPPDDWLPAQVTVLMVQPLSGGAGGFDADQESIWIEAVLTDVDPRVPEVLRLIWIITSLAIEIHTRSRTGEKSSEAWSLVSIPLVLSAASQLEMFPKDRLPIAAAMDLWRVGNESTADILSGWWYNFSESDTPLPLALAELEQMLL